MQIFWGSQLWLDLQVEATLGTEPQTGGESVLILGSNRVELNCRKPSWHQIIGEKKRHNRVGGSLWLLFGG
jgi:hypothetical protein